jgi:hypothetical protein
VQGLGRPHAIGEEGQQVGSPGKAVEQFARPGQAGDFAPIQAALKPLDQVLPASALDADLNTFLAEVADVTERLTIDDYFRMFPTAKFDTKPSAPSPQWIYKDKSGRGEVRFKLQLPGRVEKLNPEVQWRVTWAITPDWSKPEWAPYEHLIVGNTKNPLHITDGQLRYGYEYDGQPYINLAYGQAAHLVSLTDMDAFVAISQARLASNPQALRVFNDQLFAYKTAAGLP